MRSALQNLGRLIPEGEFYRWNDGFANSVRSCCFLVVCREFLLNGNLIDLEGVSRALGCEFWIAVERVRVRRGELMDWVGR